MNNNATLTYTLSTRSSFLNHGWSKAMFLRDTSDTVSATTRLEIDAQVRSGDYFITLATTLDQIGKDTANWHTRVDLEDLVSDLIYLQDNYRISKNDQSE